MSHVTKKKLNIKNKNNMSRVRVFFNTDTRVHKSARDYNRQTEKLNIKRECF